MARTQQEIEDELNDVRRAMKAMLSTKEGASAFATCRISAAEWSRACGQPMRS